MKAEDYAIVLDFLPRGRSTDYKTEPLVQILGKEYFTLLEVIAKPGIELKAQEEVYVGKDDRPKIDFIKRRVQYKDLTNNSQSELEPAIEKIVKEKEQVFVDFFNNSNAISLKRHQLELLPGLGKKHMHEILNERLKGKFISFQNIRDRVHGMQDPVTCIVKRVVEELEAVDEKFYLFARPPAQEKPFQNRRRF